MRISDWSSDVCSSDLAATDGLAAFPLRADFTQSANLEHVGIVPALFQGGVGKDELELRLEAQELFLVLHDEVIGALGAVAVRLIVVGGVRPALVLVDGEIAVMHVLGFGREVDFLEQAGKFGKLGGAAIFFLEHRRIFAFHRSEEHTSELQSLMRSSSDICCL